MTQEHLRIFTYVLLGMTLGVILAALFIDVSKSSKTTSPATEQEKESKTHESNSTGAE